MFRQQCTGLACGGADGWGTMAGMGADFSIDDAIVVAARAHVGQRDKGRPSLPYLTHPMAVMASFDEPELQMIAVLHDAVEDGPANGVEISLESLRAAGAPERVVAGVDAMTHRKGESNQQYWARVRANPDARLVKLADIDHNADEARLCLLEASHAERLRAKYRAARAAVAG